MILTWRDWVVDQAMSWNKTPYHHRGNVKGVGVDCGRLLYNVYSPLVPGSKPYPEGYAQDWAVHEENFIYRDFVEVYFDRVDRDERADVVVAQIGKSLSHGMINIGNNKYIHAWGRTGHGSVRISTLQAVLLAAKQTLQFRHCYSLKKEWRDITSVMKYVQ